MIIRFQEAEDSEFALRLEPNNQEIKKQYAEVKSLYGKEILQKAPGAVSSSVHGVQKGGKSDTKVNAYGVNSVSNSTQGTGISTAQKDKIKGSDEEVLVKKSPSVEEIKDKSSEAGSKTESRQVNGSHADATLTSQKKSVQATSPSALPQIFKNALSAPMLIDIIKCVATFFVDDMNLAVKYLQNLAQVPRFNILIMCLSAADKADLLKLWDEVFCSEATPIEHAEILDNLRTKYCLK
ncbi:hypothetical protein RCOM_1435290 [Ricinus communis]|uniref:RNA-polymerase II-associated protein 3-like C-terminal domain-containing protein n=1 Tax=Ricinus communis TaxID=3988 RepID=B9RFJ4_RICCO|nr:hypothetical protein RCOM_1435290 [Ricinus communis]